MDSNIINSEKFVNYFDKIYLLNLKRRPDRLKMFLKNNREFIPSQNIEIIEAIDGEKIINESWNYSNGALGCRLSHMKLLKDALSNNYSQILVFEDDAKIDKTIFKKLNHLINYAGNNWDMIYFGANHYETPIDIDGKIIKITCALTTHCFAIKGNIIPILIDKIENDKRPVDAAIAALHSTLKVYGFKQDPVTQSQSYSDIELVVTNHNTTSLKKIINLIRKLSK